MDINNKGRNDALHVMPNNDLRDHIDAPHCWCKPEFDADFNIYIHKSMDRREDFEEGKRKLS